MSKQLTRSFAGGILSPELLGRPDLNKFQTGVAEAINFLVYPHGPLANRTGDEYVLEVKDSTKLTVGMPFIYSTAQSYALEFGDQYVRFHTQGATVLEAAQNISAITKANPGVLTYVGADPANGDWMFLSGIGGMTQLNGRFVKVANVNAGANTFELIDLAGANINTTGYGTYTAGGTIARVYTIASPYLEADLLDLHFAQSADVLTITHPNYETRELRRAGATSWSFTIPASTPTQVAPTAVVVTPNAVGAVTYSYVVTAIATSGLEESLGSTAGSNAVCQDLSAAGAFNTVTWTNAAGAVRYNVYRGVNGVYGFVGQAATGATGFKDINYAPDFTITPLQSSAPFVGAGNYPTAVGYYQGRRWYGGTNNKPQNLFATRSGTESNMCTSIPTKDDDAIEIRIAARQVQAIRHIVPLGDLLLLTSGGEWMVFAANSDALTPASIDPRLQSALGANMVQPILTSNAVLFAFDRGGRIGEMQYSLEQKGYATNDLSIYAPHLFDGYTIKSMAWSRGLHRTAWFVRSDGKMLGCTYVPEQQVSAWHLHETDGFYESVCTIPEGAEDVLYSTVRRTLNGRTVRTVERRRTRLFASQAAAFFVDCGLTYSGAPATTISGLWHLEGETVAILADGAVLPQQIVVNGAITLDQAASIVNVGLPIRARAKTLPISLEMEALGQGATKNINNLWLRVHESSGIFAGPSYDKLREVKQRTTEPYGSPPNLFTGVKSIAMVPSWNEEGQVCIEQSNPLPLTLLSMTTEVTIGG